MEIEMATALQAMKSGWSKYPLDWDGNDPCGSSWVGISCHNNRIISISVSNLNVIGKLTEDISALSELHILDLSYNAGLSGPLPRNIGELKKLRNLILVGCSFTGQIPESIGSLRRLINLSLNLNHFNGTIPASVGQLSNLQWFDISDNQIEGKIPVSEGTSPGLDMLLEARNFHFGNNKLSGVIPEKLFSSNMTLLYVLFDGNQFTGEIPDSLSLVKSLTVLRLDRNRLTGDVPPCLNNLTNLNELYLANNRFTGSLPNLTSLSSLYTLDLSNNTFDFSPIPSWISSLRSLSTLRMEAIQLVGPLPFFLFSLTHLQTIILKRNRINETLDFGAKYSNELEFVDLQSNDITEYKPAAYKRMQVILADNPVCVKLENVPTYCLVIPHKASFSAPEINCAPCDQGKEPSPRCYCVYPYTGTLFFRSPSFSAAFNSPNFLILQLGLTSFLKKFNHPVDTVAIRNIRTNATDHQLQIDILIFPLGRESFTEMAVTLFGFAFSNHMYKPPVVFGSYYFKANVYSQFYDGECSKSGKYTGIIIGSVIGTTVLLLLVIIAVVYYVMRRKKRAERAADQTNPFAMWDSSSIDAPRLMGAKAFTFEELERCTNNFSEANSVGGGGYGQVFKGILPSGQLVAIKRAQQGSSQGRLEFKTEIEILSRVSHKNIVRLLGFCFDQCEQMLVYEYIPNGSLRDSLSGKSGIRLDWTTRLRITLGLSQGLAYIHELADPQIIHRDIKSSNILLDETLTVKIADFGLSKLAGDPNVTTQVKGTVGYMDPEYYKTSLLSEKSDVYSFGAVMVELLTGKRPVDKGRDIVTEVKMKIDRSRNMYDLQDLLDPTIIASGGNLHGFKRYVKLSLRCVEEEGVKRPSMGEVVREMEEIVQVSGLVPNVDLASTSGA